MPFGGTWSALLRTMVMAAAVLLHCTAAQLADCSTLYGPGCTQCENVTISWPYGDHGGDGGHGGAWSAGGGGGGRWSNSAAEGLDGRHGHRKLLHVRWNSWAGSDTGSSYNITRLVCTACSQETGYVLVPGRNNATYGQCHCGPGWGVVPANTSSSSPWEHARGSYSCVDCRPSNQVPLTDASNLRLFWNGTDWSLVLASSLPPYYQGDSHWHGGWRWWGVSPPYYHGQCVSCPGDSQPSPDFTQCDALNSTSPSPSPTPNTDPVVVGPSPSPSPEPPSPSPTPTNDGTSGACVSMSSDSLALLAADIASTCGANATGLVSLDYFNWAADPALLDVWLQTDPDIMSESSLGLSVDNLAECSKMAQYLDQNVTVTWLANDTGITCSPATGTFVLTLPAAFNSSAAGAAAAVALPRAGGVAAGNVPAVGVLKVPAAMLRRTPVAASSAFKKVVRGSRTAAAAAVRPTSSVPVVPIPPVAGVPIPVAPLRATSAPAATMAALPVAGTATAAAALRTVPPAAANTQPQAVPAPLAPGMAP